MLTRPNVNESADDATKIFKTENDRQVRREEQRSNRTPPLSPHHNLSIYTYRVLFLSLDILYTLVSANVKLFNLFKESLRVREREGERNEKNSNTISEVYLLRYFREIAAL